MSTPSDSASLIADALERANHPDHSEGATFASTGGVQSSSSGITSVAVRQEHAGVPVHLGVRMVRYARDGSFDRVTGPVVEVARDTPITPKFSAAQAVRAVLLALLERDAVPWGLPFTADPPEVVAELPGPERATVLRKAPFAEPVLASLVVDPTASSSLVWEIRLSFPEGRGYIAHVAAARGRKAKVVELRPTAAHAASANVFPTNPGGHPRVRRALPLPRPEYPGFGGATLGRRDWIELDATEGNNARVRGQDSKTVRAQMDPNGDLLFDPADAQGLDQCVVNAFFLCNYLHDFFYLLGFTEAEGNFQNENDPGVGKGNDALDVFVLDQSIDGWASYDHRADGSSPIIRFGRHRSGNHTALDAHLVMHEFVHGVLNRMIGTKQIPLPMLHEESEALAEGFCDYFALTLANALSADAGGGNDLSYGSWLVGAEKPLRPRSYEGYDRTYGHLTTPRIDKHDAGQVWCAALLDFTAAVGDAEASWQVVFDAIGLLHPGPAGPTFLHARAAVLDAFDASSVATPALSRAVRDAFSARGMGAGAESRDAKYKNVKESMNPLP